MDQLDPQQFLAECSNPASSLKTIRDFRWTDTLAALADPSLDPLFWRAERLGAESAWWEHVPFAHWIVCATSPRVLVELGTHTGVSYSAFCHAVARAGIGTRCHAVDSWQGDPHAGLYGPEVLNELRAFHDERFGAFSTLLQCTFDEGRAHIEDGSIDLLHIDGLHTYEAVRHDFENWLPKLSDRAVVLFHDINVRREDFGVWRLWAELCEQYPAFDFVHGHGLGVLAVGGDTPAPVAALCKLSDPAAIAMIRTRFARLGEHWWIDTRERLLARSLSQHVAATDAQAEQWRTEVARSSSEAEQLRAEVGRHAREADVARHAAERAWEDFRTASARLSNVEQEAVRLRARADQAETRVLFAETDGGAAAARAAELEGTLAEAHAEQAHLRYELDHVLRSTFWQITGPARRAASVLPPSLRRQVRRGARVAYWVLTPHRTRERVAYFRSRREALRPPAPLAIDRPTASLARFFDADWYIQRYGDVEGAGLTPFEHFLTHGTQNLRDPNPAFDTAWYFAAYSDLRRGCVALEDFVNRGAEQGCRPFRDFDYSFYREKAGLAGISNLDMYHHYLTHGRRLAITTCAAPATVKMRLDNPNIAVGLGVETPTGFRKQAREPGIGPVWGLPADAQIRALKAPSFDNEVALFVAYSPDRKLKPHVPHYVQSLRQSGIAVVLIINTEAPLQANATEFPSEVDGLFLRQNKGYDFAAWAQVLQLHRDLFNTQILYLVNDSLIGPIDQAEFSKLIAKIRDSKADVIGLTENLEQRWHLQSYFLAFKERALRSAAFEEFFKSIVCFADKADVIREYELRLPSVLKAAGLNCAAVFPARDAHNPTAWHWKKLLEAGFPFVKAEVVRSRSADWDPGDCFEVLSTRGFDVRLAQWAAPNGQKLHAEPPQLGDPPPPIDPVAAGRPGEVTIRAADALQQIPWQPRPESTQTAADAASKKYQWAKRDKIRGIGGDLLAELQAATAAWALGEAGDLNVESLVQACGIVSLYEPPAEEAAPYSILTLQRYHEARNATTRRLCLEPKAASARSGDITISILMPVYKTPLIYLERAILSVVCQTYQNWELCIVDSGSGDPGVTAVLNYYEAKDRRIRVERIPENAGISAATNVALHMATGVYISLLDHDDMITSDALEVIANEITKDPKVDLLYTDECKIDENDIVQQLMPKPDWSPLLLTAFMYTGHFSAYRSALVRQLGGLRSRYDFSQDYDLALRVSELNPKVAHVRGYHYGWRMVSGSASVGDKPDARQSNIAALQDAVDRRGWNGTAVALPTSNRVLRSFEHEQPLVSIIIPSDDAKQVQHSVRSILTRTSYREFEILVVTNSSLAAMKKDLEDTNVSFVRYDKAFNFSEKCNIGAAAARGDFVIFYNDDVRVLTPDWINAILECLTLPGVGAVSPKLLYENNGIQHAGMVTGTRRLLGTAFHTYPRDTSANMNLAQSAREVSLLSAACLAMRKTMFAEVGGFDAVNTPREHSDVDLCFRIRQLGYSCVYTPHAELTHFGHVTMGAAEAAGKTLNRTKHDAFVIKRYGAFLADDPYFPKPMRDILYADSPEEFGFFPRYLASVYEEQTASERAADDNGVPHERRVAGATPTLDVLILSHDLSESGAPRAAYEVARVLREAGHFVVVASPSDGPYRERLRTVGADVIIDELLLTQQPHVLDFARNFDKLICNTIVCWPAVTQLYQVVDTYWYVHESELISEFVDIVPGFAAVLKSGVPIWTVSGRVSRFLNTYGVEPRVIEHGIPDRAAARPITPRDNRKVVIGVFGSYELRKGQDLAVNGMLSLPQQMRDQAELRLFGRRLEWQAEFRSNLERITDGDGSIVFFGEVDHHECLSQMTACDIILVPSRDDAASFVALDALSLGKTLVCSKTTGVSEYVEHDKSALILRKNTPPEIATALGRLIADPELRNLLAEGGREVYERTFTPSRFAERLNVALGLKPATQIRL